MSLGVGVFLIVVGAILAFAINIDVSWVDLDLVGYILMAAGVVVFIVGLILLLRRRRSTVSVRRDVDPNTGARYDTTERRDDPPSFRDDV